MARKLYRKIVNWIIHKINRKLQVNNDISKGNELHILVMQSFSCPQKRECSLSEMIINYVQEKAQQSFLDHFFKSVEVIIK